MSITQRGAVPSTLSRRRATRHRVARRGGARGRGERRPVGRDGSGRARRAARARRRRHRGGGAGVDDRGVRGEGAGAGQLRGGRGAVRGVGVLAMYLQQLRRSMLEVAADGRPRIPGPVRHVPGGRVAVGVVPRATLGQGPLRAPARRGLDAAGRLGSSRSSPARPPATEDPEAHRGVCLVLGAGNVASLGPKDALGKLFCEGKVVVLKANPVNDYLVEHWERALRALIDEGVLRVVRGGAAAGAHLVGHSLGRRGPRHRLGQDPRRDRLRPRRRGRATQGRRRSARDQARDRRARQRLAGRRRAGQLVGARPVLPGDPRRLDARQQRGVQLPDAARARDVAPLAAARGVPQRDRDGARDDPHAPRVLPGRVRPPRRVRPRAPRGPRARRPARRAPRVDRDARPRPDRRQPARAQRRGVLQPDGRDGARHRDARPVRRRRGGVLQRRGLGVAVRDDPRAPRTAEGPPRGLTRRRGGRLAALRRDRAQPVARLRVRVRGDDLGRVPRARRSPTSSRGPAWSATPSCSTGPRSRWSPARSASRRSP